MVNKARAAGTAAGIVAVIALFTSSFEGLRTKAYPDPGNPQIATICYGETQGVKFGETKSPEQCLEMLKNSIPTYLAEVDRLLPGLPEGRRIAYTDAAYNMGAGILTRRTNDVAGTSIVDLERAGNWQDACSRLLLFDHANGKKLPGLTKRRKAEYERCVGDQKGAA